MTRPYQRFQGLSLYLLVLASFVLGAFADRAGWLPGGSGQEPPGVRRIFTPFWEAWNLVERRYVDRQAVQPQRMMEGSIEGMLGSLGDVGHTTYLKPGELQLLDESLKGNLEGIGARMTVRKGRPTVVNTIPGSPAAKRLRPGDVFLEVNGKNVSDLPLPSVVDLVRGQPGTVVHLKILREGEAEPLSVDVPRAKIEVPDVTWHMLPGVPIAHVAVQNFGQQADKQLKEALEAARHQEVGVPEARVLAATTVGLMGSSPFSGLSVAASALRPRSPQHLAGLIVDVRGNPGGLRNQAVAVTSEFLTSGNVFIEKDAQGHQTPVPVEPNGIAPDLPICVLIDQGTASSAEIFAGAIQDHHRGKLVGTRTFGTGTVLQPFQLSDGSAVLLAVFEWLTPDGRQIWHHGIQPDFEVALPQGATILMPEAEGNLTAEALATSQDKQLLRGLEVLKAAIGEK